jgi:hypothetical protein
MNEANAFAPQFMAEYDRRFARVPQSKHDAHRPLRPSDTLSDVLRWKELRKLSQNLTVNYQRVLYILDETFESLALRGKTVEVHETEDGVVSIRHGRTRLEATAFRKDGNVRQQDVEDNKHLSKILRAVQQAQVARDEEKIATGRLTLREKHSLRRSLEERRGSAQPG